MSNNSELNKSFSDLYEVVKTVRFGLKPHKVTWNKNLDSGESSIFKKAKNQWILNLLKYSKSRDSLNVRENAEKELSELIKQCDLIVENLETIYNHFEKYLLHRIFVDLQLIKVIEKDLFHEIKNCERGWKNNYDKKTIKFSENILFRISEIDSFNSFDSEYGKFSELLKNKLKEILIQYKERKYRIDQFLFSNQNEKEHRIEATLLTKQEKIARIKFFCLNFLKIQKIFKYIYADTNYEKSEQQNIKIDEPLKHINDSYLFTEIHSVKQDLNIYNNKKQKNPERRISLNLRGLDKRPQGSNKDKTEEEILLEIIKIEDEILELKKQKTELKSIKSYLKIAIKIELENILKEYSNQTSNNIIKSQSFTLQEKDFVYNENQLADFIKKTLKKIRQNSFDNLNLQHKRYESSVNQIRDCLFGSELPIVVYSKEKGFNFTVNKNFQTAKNELDDIIKKLQPEGEESLHSKVNSFRKDLENVRITHYGVLIEKDEKNNKKYYLAIEPIKESIKDYKLVNLKEEEISDCNIIQYKSLTFKALEKLCLLKDSTLKVDDETFQILKEQNYLQKNQKDLSVEDQEKINFQLFKDNLLKTIIDKKNSFGVKIDNEKIKEEFSEIRKYNKLVNYLNENFYQVKKTKYLFNSIKPRQHSYKTPDIEIYQIYSKDFLLDPDFATTEKDKRILERQKNRTKTNKPNLFTIYWDQLFSNIGENNKIRINPEINLFATSPLLEDHKKSKEIFGLNKENQIQSFKIEEKQRENYHKITANFGLVFNPISNKGNYSTKKNQAREAQKSKDSKERIEVFNEYLKTHTQNDQEIYVIGLDRGENSLVSYALCKFVKKNIDKDDVKVRFSNEPNTEGWLLKEIIEAKDLSAVKVFNKNEKWKKNEFVEQKDDIYFNHSKTENLEIIYFDSENKQNAESKKIELKNINQSAKIVILPIRNKTGNKSGAYALKYLSWKENDGLCYNYRVAQEILKECRLEQKENLGEEMELINTQEFKNGFVTQLVGFLAEKVRKYNAFISLEFLNKSKKDSESSSKESNLQKTFGTSVYQIIENKIMSKLSYCILKNDKENHSQRVPKIIKIEELKNDQTN
jgi:hypothetical protein